MLHQKKLYESNDIRKNNLKVVSCDINIFLKATIFWFFFFVYKNGYVIQINNKQISFCQNIFVKRLSTNEIFYENTKNVLKLINL